MKTIFEQLLLDNKLIQAAGNGNTTLVEILLDQVADIHAARPDNSPPVADSTAFLAGRDSIA